MDIERRQHADEQLQALLRSRPDADVRALDDKGLTVALPPSLTLHGQTVSATGSSVEAVFPADWPALIATWERALADGCAETLVRSAADPSSTILVHMLDVRETHGVLIGLRHPAGSASPSPTAEPVEPVDLRPRFAQVCKDARAVLVEVDDAFAAMLGMAADELVGLRSLDLIHPDDQELAVGAWLEMLGTPGLGRRTRLRHRRADGGHVWLEVTNHNLLDDPEHGWVRTDLVDVSDEMAAQERVRASEQLLSRLTETVPVGLAQLGPDGSLAYVNEQLLALVGAPRATTLEQQLRTVVAADRPALSDALRLALHEQSDADVELRLSLPAGEERLCHLSLRVLRDAGGAVSGAIACLSDVTREVQLREQLRVRATVDALTGCLNRGTVLDRLTDALADGGVGVVFLDLDGFKPVNDRHGHAVGDQVLREVVDRISAALRPGQLLGRLGGDEFLVVCPGLPGQAETDAEAERVGAALGGPMVVADGEQLELTGSLGAAFASGGSADLLVAQADAAMYRAKTAGARADVPRQHSVVRSAERSWA